MPTPAALDAAAGRLDREADRLRQTLDEPARHTGANVWVGPAADAFGNELAAQRRTLHAAADTLHTTARELRREADAMRRAAAAEMDSRTVTHGASAWR